jgi:16S rRNA (uracil1498-N3)-methyltransferase
MTEDKSALRLYVTSPLAAGGEVAATETQSHYLLNVMRRGAGDAVVLFNGRDGEWQATLKMQAKKRAAFDVGTQRRAQEPTPDVWLLFAPLKAARLEMMIEKATELGVSALAPVTTRRTVVGNVNARRLEATAIEASEQCERLTVPNLMPARQLLSVLAEWDKDRRLFFMDEGAARDASAPPLIEGLRGQTGPAAILVGPEGGFDPDEQRHLRAQSFVKPLVLGPRILRAETAALAALACWQAVNGDWRRG